MDQRFNPVSPRQQQQMRRRAISDVLAHPEWSLGEAVAHLRRGLRLTTAELAQQADVSQRTLQDIEAGRTEGTVQTLNRILAVLGLKLWPVMRPRGSEATGAADCRDAASSDSGDAGEPKEQGDDSGTGKAAQ